MKLRKKIALMAAMSFTLPAFAYSGIEVSMTDGSSVVISMKEHPVITFSGDKLVVKTVDSTTELDRSKVKTFSYLSSSSVETVQVGDYTVDNTGTSLRFSGLPAESEITVHSVDGKLVGRATASGDYSIDLSGYSAGTYIVSVNGVSTKIAVKR